MNEQNLNEKELELINTIEKFFIKEGFNDIKTNIDWEIMKEAKMEFINKNIRLCCRICYINEVEEQLQIANIFLSESLRNKGIFKRLVNKLKDFQKKFSNIYLVITQITNEEFADKLIEKFNGRIIGVSKKDGCKQIVLE